MNTHNILKEASTPSEILEAKEVEDNKQQADLNFHKGLAIQQYTEWLLLPTTQMVIGTLKQLSIYNSEVAKALSIAETPNQHQINLRLHASITIDDVVKQIVNPPTNQKK